MFPSEMAILMAIALAGDSVDRVLDRPRDVTSEYISYLYGSLVKRGYLKKGGSGGYRLTSKAEKTLTEFLLENKDKVNELVRILQKLSIETTPEMDEIEKKAISVR